MRGRKLGHRFVINQCRILQAKCTGTVRATIRYLDCHKYFDSVTGGQSRAEQINEGQPIEWMYEWGL